jgi:chromosome partitioning protein
MGEDVLVIDLDPQAGGLTDHAGFDGVRTHPKYSLVDVMLNDDRTLTDIIISESSMAWDLIPAHEDLGFYGEKITVNLPPQESPFLQLRKAIQRAELPNRYDFILIDCPASRGPIVANAIAATLNVLIPTPLSRKGVRNIDGLAQFIDESQRRLRRSQEIPSDITTGIIGIVPNNIAATGQLTTDERKALEVMLDEYGDLVPNFYIPQRTLFTDTWRSRMTLPEFVESDDTRRLRQNEQTLTDMYEAIAEMVRHGSTRAIDDEPLANMPQIRTTTTGSEA